LRRSKTKENETNSVDAILVWLSGDKPEPLIISVNLNGSYPRGVTLKKAILSVLEKRLPKADS